MLDVLLRHGREGVASVSGIDVFIDTSLPIAAPGDLKACLGLWVVGINFLVSRKIMDGSFRTL